MAQYCLGLCVLFCLQILVWMTFVWVNISHLPQALPLPITYTNLIYTYMPSTDPKIRVLMVTDNSFQSFLFLSGVYYELNCVIPRLLFIPALKFLCWVLASQNAAIVGNMVFKDVKMRTSGWDLIQHDWCPYRKKFGHKCVFTCRKDHVKTKVEPSTS